MAKDTVIEVRIPRGGIRRLHSSVNGNPRYRITCVLNPGPEGSWAEFVTMSDAGFVYAINNDWSGKSVRRARLTLTPAGRVRDLEYIEDREIESGSPITGEFQPFRSHFFPEEQMTQHLFRFDNGFGASVIRSPKNYSGTGTWEFGVIRWFGDRDDDWQLEYGTPVAGDVLGWQTDAEVQALLRQIVNLPMASLIKVQATVVRLAIEGGEEDAP